MINALNWHCYFEKQSPEVFYKLRTAFSFKHFWWLLLYFSYWKQKIEYSFPLCLSPISENFILWFFILWRQKGNNNGRKQKTENRKQICTVVSVNTNKKKTLVVLELQGCNVQMQPSRGVLKERCSENMQQIYRKTPMPKCDWNHTSAYVFSCKFAAYFQNTFC